MASPDVVTVHDKRREIEARIGIEPLDELLEQRHQLVDQVAGLRALHGPFGTYSDQRRVDLAIIAQQKRAETLRDGVKMTEAAITDASHADPRYVEMVIRATQERAQWSMLEDEIQAINDRIMRDQALTRFASAEMHL